MTDKSGPACDCVDQRMSLAFMINPSESDPRMSIASMINPSDKTIIRPRKRKTSFTKPLKRYLNTHPDKLPSEILANLTEHEIDTLRKAALFKNPKDVPRSTELLNKRVHGWIKRGVPKNTATGNKMRWSQLEVLLTDEIKATLHPREFGLLGREFSTLNAEEKRERDTIRRTINKLYKKSIASQKANDPAL